VGVALLRIVLVVVLSPLILLALVVRECIVFYDWWRARSRSA
jgi:hypothetical protein